MTDNLSYKINSCFNILDLKPGADARQIRSAFRYLARTHHPDVAGVLSTKKYEQIANAYIFLKNLTLEELSLYEAQLKRPKKNLESFFDGWKKKQAKKEAAREAEEAAKETREREIYDRVDLILNKCANEIDLLQKKRQNEDLNQVISDIIIRLGASREEVRLMAMQNISEYVNIPKIMDALLNMLNTYPITGKVLDCIDKFNLPHIFMLKIVKAVSENVEDLEEKEALAFIRKYLFMTAGRKDLISGFMEHPSPKIAELLIIRWTFQELPSELILKKLFSDIQNEKLIILTLNMLKRYDKRTYPIWLTRKIAELSTHYSASVKYLARAISKIENMVK